MSQRFLTAAFAGALALASLLAEGALYLFADKLAEGLRSALEAALLLIIAVAVVGALMLLAIRR